MRVLTATMLILTATKRVLTAASIYEKYVKLLIG
jgi:hypothetical protein